MVPDRQGRDLRDRPVKSANVPWNRRFPLAVNVYNRKGSRYVDYEFRDRDTFEEFCRLNRASVISHRQRTIRTSPAAMPRRETLAKLHAAAPAVLPSMLLCDFTNLRQEVDRLHAAGVKALHLDVMDGHFVPNLTYGLPLVEAFRKLTELPLDVHLMIDNPLEFAEGFAKAGADSLTVHIEALPDPRATLRRIHDLDLAAGLALNPDTPLSAIEPFLDECDIVLVMSVMPGFGGQKFERAALEKLATLRGRVRDDQLLEVDGGVNDRTIADCAKAGANLFVVGSAIFRTEDYGQSVGRLNSLIGGK